ncbi:hypothetical protein GCM10009304_02780 [Pseudomonas matsuisoli]|uniref:Uncharacterized protein n=1 Tax=Pseudomonas matsuisoli TaxID=1515666 RepID=A0A917URR6_9PSED|nr:hypothetical protein GCM10009304_02780 [Pseudomonas matsuisoli]
MHVVLLVIVDSKQLALANAGRIWESEREYGNVSASNGSRDIGITMWRAAERTEVNGRK